MRRVHSSVDGPHVVKRVGGGVGLTQRLHGALRLDGDNEAVGPDVLGVPDQLLQIMSEGKALETHGTVSVPMCDPMSSIVPPRGTRSFTMPAAAALSRSSAHKLHISTHQTQPRSTRHTAPAMMQSKYQRGGT